MMNPFKPFVILWLVFSAGLPLSAGETAPPQKTEVIRVEMVSVIGMSAAVSRLGNCVAPHFKDTLALFTVALTVGGSTFGMDLTRPVSIVFYEVGKKPSMRITAYAIPNVQVIQKKAALWDMKLQARLENGLVTLFTDDLADDLTPASAPGKNLSDSILSVEAFPEKIGKHFSFRSLNTRNENILLLFQALDELMSEVEAFRLSFRADDNFLIVKLSARARKNSALESYLSRPLPEKGPIESFDGAGFLSLFRLAPNESLCRYGTAYFFGKRQNALVPVLPSAITGFAVLSSGKDAVPASVKLTLGIRPDHASGIVNAVAGMGYTPYPNLFQVTKNPPLFCSVSGNRLAFYYTDALEKDKFERLLKPVPLSLNAGESPFAFYDLSRPDRPIAELRFKGNTAEMIFRAPDEWFAALPPLMDVPLHKFGTPVNLPDKMP